MLYKYLKDMDIIINILNNYNIIYNYNVYKYEYNNVSDSVNNIFNIFSTSKILYIIYKSVYYCTDTREYVLNKIQELLKYVQKFKKYVINNFDVKNLITYINNDDINIEILYTLYIYNFKDHNLIDTLRNKLNMSNIYYLDKTIYNYDYVFNNKINSSSVKGLNIEYINNFDFVKNNNNNIYYKFDITNKTDHGEIINGKMINNTMNEFYNVNNYTKKEYITNKNKINNALTIEAEIYKKYIVKKVNSLNEIDMSVYEIFNI